MWAVRGDGTMAAMTYDPDQVVMGWARRQLGNSDSPLSAKSACRITDPAGRLDQIWIAAEAPFANGGTGQHWILRMAPMWQEDDEPAGAILTDAALSYDAALAEDDDPVTGLIGLDHLEGQRVDILADGKPHTSRIVTGGAITLDYPASRIHVGLPFPARMTSLSPEGGQHEGTAQTKLKRMVALNLRVAETQGIRVRVQGGDMIPVETRVPVDAMDQAVPLFTGELTIPTVGTYDRLAQWTIERYQPTPATLIAAVPVLEVGET